MVEERQRGRGGRPDGLEAEIAGRVKFKRIHGFLSYGWLRLIFGSSLIFIFSLDGDLAFSKCLACISLSLPFVSLNLLALVVQLRSQLSVQVH